MMIHPHMKRKRYAEVNCNITNVFKCGAERVGRVQDQRTKKNGDQTLQSPKEGSNDEWRDKLKQMHDVGLSVFSRGVGPQGFNGFTFRWHKNGLWWWELVQAAERLPTYLTNLFA